MTLLEPRLSPDPQRAHDPWSVPLVCDARVTEAIGTHLREHYYDDYAMILFSSDVGVLRPEKF